MQPICTDILKNRVDFEFNVVLMVYQYLQVLIYINSSEQSLFKIIQNMRNYQIIMKNMYIWYMYTMYPEILIIVVLFAKIIQNCIIKEYHYYDVL